MSGLIDEFLRGSSRITTRIFYYVPLNEGQEPLKVRPTLIGEKPVELNHAGVIQEYIYQVDDKSDLHADFADVFNSIMNASHGNVKILDRAQRITLMGAAEQLATQQKTAQGQKLESDKVLPVPQIIIPRKTEEYSGGMRELTQAFHTLVPFPKVRSFLQFWQDKLDGPLNHIQFSHGSIANASLGTHSEFTVN